MAKSGKDRNKITNIVSTKKERNWDDDATWGSDIIGNGAVQGNFTGKVKTRQIGFVRNGKEKPKTKSRMPVSRKK